MHRSNSELRGARSLFVLGAILAFGISAGCASSGSESGSGSQDMVSAPAGAPSASTSGSPSSTPTLTADSPITVENWGEHPKVLATRKAIEDVLDQKIDLKDETKTLCSSSTHETRTASTDEAGKIRRYSVGKFDPRGGSDEFVYIYDSKGLLRAVQRFQTDGPTADLSKLSVTDAFFDEAGKRFWEVVTLGGVDKVPNAPLALPSDAAQPAKMFDAPPACN
jgi:hypothetical protein